MRTFSAFIRCVADAKMSLESPQHFLLTAGQQIVHSKSGLCLVLDGDLVTMATCVAGQQQWEELQTEERKRKLTH